MSNFECRMSKGGFALGLRSQFGEVGSLSLFVKMDRSTQSLDPEALEGKLTTGRIHLFDVRCWTFDAYSPPLEGSMFISFFFDLTGRFFGRRLG